MSRLPFNMSMAALTSLFHIMGSESTSLAKTSALRDRVLQFSAMWHTSMSVTVLTGASRSYPMGLHSLKKRKVNAGRRHDGRHDGFYK